MPRLDGDVFFFGTAIGNLLKTTAPNAPDRQNAWEARLIEEAFRQG
jgi:hypothetical protein